MKRLWLIAAVAAALAGCGGTQGRENATGTIVMTVTEKGFEPATVTVRAGTVVRLLVTRKTERTCATEFVMAARGIRQDLPLNRPVEITFTPERAETLRFACAMNMIGGAVVVE